MKGFVQITLLSILFRSFFCHDITDTGWGFWHSFQNCPPNTAICAANLRYEDSCGRCDDTAANGLAIKCCDAQGHVQTDLMVAEGHWGGWKGYRDCPQGYLAYGVSIRLEPFQGGGIPPDDTSMNGFRMMCRKVNDPYNKISQEVVVWHGDWGDWTPYKFCPPYHYIGNIQARIEPPQSSKDDTGMNGVQFSSCIRICPPGTHIQGNTCTHCPQSTYQDIYNANSCKPVTSCKPGWIISTESTFTSDRVCIKCPEGNYQLDNECIAVTQCKPGWVTSKQPTVTSDRVCTNCSEGTYQDENERCQLVSECAVGWVMEEAATLTSDRVCVECPDGFMQVGEDCKPAPICFADHLNLLHHTMPATSFLFVDSMSKLVFTTAAVVLVLFVGRKIKANQNDDDNDDGDDQNDDYDGDQNDDDDGDQNDDDDDDGDQNDDDDGDQDHQNIERHQNLLHFIERRNGNCNDNYNNSANPNKISKKI